MCDDAVAFRPHPRVVADLAWPGGIFGSGACLADRLRADFIERRGPCPRPYSAHS